jgi:4-hydroxythreonine-4-phosphate dehydrogenase
LEKIFITCGDINGIGNELILKFLNSGLAYKENAYIVIGNRDVFDETSEILNIRTADIQNTQDPDKISGGGFYFNDIPVPGLMFEPGIATACAGKLSGLAVKKGVELAAACGGSLVTAPINKYSLHLGGFNYPGHTEFIAELLNTDRFLMILDGAVIRVALVTTHLALKDVPAALSADSILFKGALLYQSLVRDYGIREPKIVVCALNPHAGDSGLFGDEESIIISPAVERLNSEIARGKGKFTGPMPSDTAFTKNVLEKTDAYLVMYHDQGLIPLKLLSFGSAVNFTAGLPIVRTSPDHGTAYDISGKGIADIKSFANAVKMAGQFIGNRILNQVPRS